MAECPALILMKTEYLIEILKYSDFLSSNCVRGEVEDALCDPRGGDWPGPLWLGEAAVWRRPEKIGRERVTQTKN